MRAKHILLSILFLLLFVFISFIAIGNAVVGAANNDIFSYFTGAILDFYAFVSLLICTWIINKYKNEEREEKI